MLLTLRLTVLVVAGLLVGCSNYHGVFFAEHTHFGAQIKVNPTENKPVDVNMGYDRGIFTVVPRTKKGEEASSVLSKTDIYVKWTERGEVGSVFATGQAAKDIAGDRAKEEALFK